MQTEDKGHPLVGLPVTPDKIQAVSSINQLQAYGLRRPSLVAKASEDSELASARKDHDAINRAVTKLRLDRAKAYAAYMQMVEVDGGLGGVPAMTIYIGDKLEPKAGEPIFEIPYGKVLVAIDGETQLEGRHILRDWVPETGDNLVALTLYHGISFDAAKQIVHDYNKRGLSINEEKTVSFNTTGALSVARKAAMEANNLVESMLSAGSKPTKKTLLSQQQLTRFIAGFMAEDEGLNRGMSDKVIDGLNFFNTPRVNPDGQLKLNELVGTSLRDDRIRLAHPSLWIAAGVLLSKGREVDSLNWEDAATANVKAQIPNVEGEKLPLKERMHAIASAM